MTAPAEDDGYGYDRFQLIVNGPALFSGIVAGIELGVFDALIGSGPVGFDDMQRSIDIPGHQLRVLLLALCETGLVQKHDDQYFISATAERLLAKDEPGSWRNTLIGWQRFQYPAFMRTTQALRSGRNVALDDYPGDGSTLYERLALDAEAQAAYHDSLGPFTILFADALFDNSEFRTVRHMLDVGGGDGTTATEFIKRYPDAEVTVFDMPSVTRHAESVERSDAHEQIHFRSGDIFADDFPEDVDAILFSHVLEPFSPAQNAHLIKKAVNSLRPGGRVFLYGMTIGANETRGALSARLSIYLNVLVSGTGMAYPVDDYAQWARDAGCGSVLAFRELPYEHGLVVGIK